MSEFAPADVETIRLIDNRQAQLLEDIDLLNARILALLEEYNPSKEEIPAVDSAIVLGQSNSQTASDRTSDGYESAA